MRPILWAGVLSAAAALAFPAQAEPRPYRGPHPVDLGGEWHEEASVHVHDTLPVGLAPFDEVDGVLVFLGDPVAYGWEGPAWTYDGVHPLPPRIGEYCGIGETHRHPFAPEGRFREGPDGSWRYVGALRGGIPLHRPGRLEPSEERQAERQVGIGPPVLLTTPFCGVVQETAGGVTTTFTGGGPFCLPAARVVVRPPRAERPRRHDPRPAPRRPRVEEPDRAMPSPGRRLPGGGTSTTPRPRRTPR